MNGYKVRMAKKEYLQRLTFFTNFVDGLYVTKDIVCVANNILTSRTRFKNTNSFICVENGKRYPIRVLSKIYTNRYHKGYGKKEEKFRRTIIE